MTPKPIITKPAVDKEVSQWTTYTQDVFRKCDANKSGYINKAEYVKCSGKKDPQWFALLKQFDTNKDQLLGW